MSSESTKLELVDDGRLAPAAPSGRLLRWSAVVGPTRAPDGSERPKPDTIVYIFAMKMLTVATLNLGFPALLSVWVPNIFFAFVAVILFKAAQK